MKQRRVINPDVIQAIARDAQAVLGTDEACRRMGIGRKALENALEGKIGELKLDSLDKMASSCEIDPETLIFRSQTRDLYGLVQEMREVLDGEGHEGEAVENFFKHLQIGLMLHGMRPHGATMYDKLQIRS